MRTQKEGGGPFERAQGTVPPASVRKSRYSSPFLERLPARIEKRIYKNNARARARAAGATEQKRLHSTRGSRFTLPRPNENVRRLWFRVILNTSIYHVGKLRKFLPSGARRSGESGDYTVHSIFFFSNVHARFSRLIYVHMLGIHGEGGGGMEKNILNSGDR